MLGREEHLDGSSVGHVVKREGKPLREPDDVHRSELVADAPTR